MTGKLNWALFALLVSMVFVFVVLPNLIRSRGPGFNAIVNNLRQIDSAKQAVSLEKGITNGDYRFSEAELSPYIGRSATGGL